VIATLLQASATAGLLNAGSAAPLQRYTVALQVITGAVLSITLIVWLAEELLPQASTAVHVRVVEYVLGQEPFVVTSL
jgi:hypothetical protein